MTALLQQSIIELLDASRDDEHTLTLPVSDRAFGFHAQQAIEKLLKALITAHGLRYTFTHDLVALIERTLALGERVPIDVFSG